MANLVNAEISEALDGQLRHGLLCQTRRDRGRPTTVNTSSSALVDALEGEEPTLGGEHGECDGRHETISSVTVPLIVTIPLADELILANRAKLKCRDAYNK